MNGDLKETFMMKQPEVFEVPGKENFVCKLNQTIYGLKQSAKAWNEKLNTVLKQLGFIQGEAGPCLHIKETQEGKIYLISYVDDLIIASKDEGQIIQTGNNLGKSFQLNNLGKLRHYLGIEIDQDEDGFYRINQAHYIEKMLRSVGLQDAKLSMIPLDAGYIKAREDEEPMEDNSYWKFIGKLLYISVNTRPRYLSVFQS